MFKTVLFPIDESRDSRQAVETVVELVKFHQSRLILLSVVEANSDHPDAMASAEAVANLLQNAKSVFSQSGIEAEAIEREGKPAFTICDVADEIGADLIIMGCRGLGLTTEGASDSVTNRVISLSPCPVLVVP
ncbi:MULTISPECIES: universal stress protein [Leptolyngbya]|jgi:nucleotide-binding universal stress UspA family protein|uniref:UspA domain-containing protein n=2 Tax=Leptolyngbya boryana TaxID=1184 RepID=A0A1Z4JM02_LEPBY|nr:MULTISPECIES: universal stress protein [Leptolyngbya]BAY57726.1 UspA domain-containing protein [Leptolyngbya boryana NIES-2135]MBD1858703.1 universal stress protein [Leptolyngbya sp. FACHB-1624]MBD2367678.1 universal stress protein [Leptolyngbya sp. FACHB-161]MBD2374202.1 universal stress protein [Leptolyngbya sp. FACHB-238]MBD2398827.1 universal stress protein [Leptolyngbya sp. FACHB-239]